MQAFLDANKAISAPLGRPSRRNPPGAWLGGGADLRFAEIRASSGFAAPQLALRLPYWYRSATIGFTFPSRRAGGPLAPSARLPGSGDTCKQPCGSMGAASYGFTSVNGSSACRLARIQLSSTSSSPHAASMNLGDVSKVYARFILGTALAGRPEALARLRGLLSRLGSLPGVGDKLLTGGRANPQAAPGGAGIGLRMF